MKRDLNHQTFKNMNKYSSSSNISRFCKDLRGFRYHSINSSSLILRFKLTREFLRLYKVLKAKTIRTIQNKEVALQGQPR
jgi:hypothetical protein